MKLKTSLLSILIIAVCSTAFAQDKIYKKNGDVVEVKIKSVGIKTLTYVRFDNQSGPEYTIIKNEIDKIVYQNGSEEEFGRGRAPRASRHAKDEAAEPEEKIKYKHNVLAIAPLQFSENGLGFGLSYEHALDKKGIIAFYLPAAITFDLNNGTYLNQTTGNYQNIPADAMVYAMPGIKVYPTGCNGLVRYSIGPSLVIGDGQKSSQTYDPTGNGNATSYITQSHLVLGMIVNNTLNINPSPHIFLGLEFGFGFTYLNRIGGLNQGTEGLVQGGFKIGYRF